MQNKKEQNPKESVDVMETVLFTDIQVAAIRRAPFHSISHYIALVASFEKLRVRVSFDGRQLIAHAHDFNKAKAMFENAVRYN